MADDTNIVNFRNRPDSPPVPPPPLPPAPRAQAAIEQAAAEPGPSGSWPRLPGIAGMRPPRAVAAPALPESAPSDGEGVFVPPVVADPENPTAQEILATCLALMTALGVAAAQSMWHSARRRQAAAAKARGKTSASHSDGRTPKGTRGAGSSGPSLLRSLGGGGGGKGSRAFGHKNKPHGKDTAHRSPHGRPPKGPKGKGPKGKHGFGHAALKAARKGTKAWKNRDKAKHPKDSTGQAKASTDKNTPGPKTKPSPKPAETPGRRLTWKAPKDGATGSKRWSGRTGTTGKTPKRKKPKSSQGTPDFTRPSIAPPKTWKAPKAKKPKSGRTGARPWSKTSSPKQPKDNPGRTEENRQRTPPPPPPPGFSGMRPPPAAGRTTRITVERVDQDQPAQPRPEAADLALTEGPRALSAPVRVKTTQYSDSDLTVGDVIEADKDMGEEILAGAAVTRSTADGCDLLMTKLEALYAEVLRLKVPGILAGMVVRLMEKTATVKGKADAIASALPAASEAITVAGSNAESRHKPLADTTRDMGHIQPAERDYHNE